MNAAVRSIAWLTAAALVPLAIAAENSPATGVASVITSETTLSRLRFAYTIQTPVDPRAGETSEATLLPKFEVKEKPLYLTPRDVQSRSALVAEAEARYLNPVYQKTGGQLMAVLEIITNPLGGWHPNVATATTFYAMDERLRRLKAASESIEVYRFENPAKYKELRELLFDSYLHGPNRRPGVLQRR